MSIKHEYNVPLSTLSTFRMGGMARNVVTLENQEDIREFFQNFLKNDTKWFLLGGGSNVVFPDGDCDSVIVRFGAGEIKIIENQKKENGDEGAVFVSADMGAVWDDVVKFAVENNLSGIEALSAIPGTACATPVQNVGAYGVEIKDVLHSLKAYDIAENKFVEMSNAECQFGYRDSFFKSVGKGRYIIVEVTFALSKASPKIPQYPGVAEYLSENFKGDIGLSEIRQAITAIRWKKLPNPKEIPSVGSFFKNPFVSAEQAEKLRQDFPNIKLFPSENGTVKVPAGWLIENVGLKGHSDGALGVYEGNALVLINKGGATREDLHKFVTFIIEQVQNKFGITLTPEPELL